MINRPSPFPSIMRLAALALLLTLVGHAAARAAPPAACTPILRPQDSVWLVDCRGLDCSARAVEADRMRYWRYDREKSWSGSSLDELLATDDVQSATIIFAHGNRIEPDEAFTKGWHAYRAVARGADDRAIRFVIWSWPSERVPGLINDGRTKAWRTNPAGYYMAWLVDRISPEAPISLWGHSFGARIVTGALHLLGGGSLDQYKLAKRDHATRQPLDVVLMAAALDNDWLLPGHYHGRALSQVDAMLLVNNSCDALLKRYHRLYGRRACQEALGYTGMGNWGLSTDDWNKIRQLDACSSVGRAHWFHLYHSATDLIDEARPYLMFEVDGPAAPPKSDVGESVATTASEP
jgi:hypothetical protein